MFSQFGYDDEMTGTEVAVLTTLAVLVISALVILSHGG